MRVRIGEIEKTRFRSDRFFIVDEKVYFTTREGLDLGPFRSKSDAHRALQVYVHTVNNEHACPRKAAKVALEGGWAKTLYH